MTCQRCGECVAWNCRKCGSALCYRLTGEECERCRAPVQSIPNQGRSAGWDRMFAEQEQALRGFPALPPERAELLRRAAALGCPPLDGRPAGRATWGYEVTAARGVRVLEIRKQLERAEAAAELGGSR